MKSKTQIAKEYFINGNYKSCLKIVKGFDRIFTKDEMKILSRTYEMISNINSSFYQQLGFNKEDQLNKSIQIIKDKLKI